MPTITKLITICAVKILNMSGGSSFLFLKAEIFYVKKTAQWRSKTFKESNLEGLVILFVICFIALRFNKRPFTQREGKSVLFNSKRKLFPKPKDGAEFYCHFISFVSALLLSGVFNEKLRTWKNAGNFGSFVLDDSGQTYDRYSQNCIAASIVQCKMLPFY